MAEERDWAPIMAMMAHLYHFKPWDVERLSEEQLQMYLSQAGFVRLMDHMPTLQYSFSKYDDEAIGKLLSDVDKKADPNSLRARGWRAFIRSYQTDSDEAEKAQTAAALPIRPETAAAIVAWVEFGEMSRAPDGPRVWREDIMPIWANLCATADLVGATLKHDPTGPGHEGPH